jgi:hypothetical protein
VTPRPNLIPIAHILIDVKKSWHILTLLYSQKFDQSLICYFKIHIGDPQQFHLHMESAQTEECSITFCMKLTAMMCLDNYCSQFHRPFCEQVRQSTLSTVEAIRLCSRSPSYVYGSPNAMFPLPPASISSAGI